MSVPALTVVIPTRNERENVPRLLAALRAALGELSYEIVFVDDSTDGTDAMLAEVARRDPRVTLHHRDHGDGLAGAVVAGFGFARGRMIGVLDADLQHPPEIVPVLVRRMQETDADVVVASRYLPGAGRPGLSPWRALVSQATRVLTRVVLKAGRASSDPLSGCFLIRRDVVDGVALRPVGFKILLEILARGRWRRVAEVPYVFVERGAGRTKATLRQGVDLFRHLAMLAASSPEDSRLWKFLLVGVSGVVVNMLIFWLFTRVLTVYFFWAGVVAGLVSTFTNFFLNNSFTWADRRERGLGIFLQRLGKYYVATGTGYVIYLGLLWALTHLGLAPLLSNLVAVALGGLFNYAMHNIWTWRTERTA